MLLKFFDVQNDVNCFSKKKINGPKIKVKLFSQSARLRSLYTCLWTGLSVEWIIVLDTADFSVQCNPNLPSLLMISEVNNRF